MRYSVTLERGRDGSYLAWVHELPGCFARGASRDEVLSALPGAIAEFRERLKRWGEPVADGEIGIRVAEEVETPIEAGEDTEVLLAPDREPLALAVWERIERWLAHSRRELRETLSAVPEEQLEEQVQGGTRTVRETLVHIGFVELMYAAWTFDLRSREGLEAFLAWTRDVTTERLTSLARCDDGSVTYAEWAGAPRPEPWTAWKAARRLLWHELLHLPELAERRNEP